MKKMVILLCIACIGVVSCKQEARQTENENPFFSEYNTPFKVPPFEKVKFEHYMPAFERGMAEHKEEVTKIINSTEKATFKNTIEALDNAGEILRKVATVFFNEASINTNDELDSLQIVLAPILAAHGDEIRLDPKYFQKIKEVYDSRNELELNAEQLFILENQYKGLARNGAELDSTKKEELKIINQKLSVLTVQFEQNDLAEAYRFKLVIEDEADLAGLPESVRDAGAAAANAEGLEGKWVYTTKRPSMYPFLQYSAQRDLREKLYMAYTNRGNHDDDKDNKEIVAKIMKLRVERANLLGYKTHAHLTLEPRMAGTPDKAIELLDQLMEAALPIAKNEAKQMQAVIDSEGGNFKLASWDWWYYAEKIRMAKYNLDENEVRPYFKLENVREGAFWVAEQLYGITFTPIDNIPLPHPDAQAFEVKEADGSHLSILYMDFHPRESKGGGAWCGGYRDHHFEKGKEIMPVVTIVCNFTKPAGDTPSLLSMDEVSTLFHEFGHALDGMFSQTTYQSGFIAWDFVELPSQIMEHWVTEPEVLKQYAKHYQTGEVIPEALVNKMDAASKFNQGFVNVEILAASLLDLAYHTIEKPIDIDIAKFEKDFLNSIGLIPEIESRYRTTYFGHIISGYDAGYYSYTWAAVLDHDAYEAFKENGIFDKETASRFRTAILEKNGIENAMDMFVNFRGREPIIEPLLKNRGLN